MPDEEVVVEQDQETVPTESDDTEEIEDVVEGFEAEPEKDPEPEPEPEPDPEPEKVETESPLEGEMKDLKKKVHDLNKALHETRSKKEEKEELTPEQIKTLMVEHKDDPDTLYNIIDYMGKRAAKETTKEAVQETKNTELEEKSTKFVTDNYPELRDETSAESQRVASAVSIFGLENHPAAKFLATSAIVIENIPALKKQWFEEGKAAGLKDKTEKTRKQSIKDTSPLPATKPTSETKSSGLGGTMKSTADQLGLTPSQRKIVSKLVPKKAMEA